MGYYTNYNLHVVGIEGTDAKDETQVRKLKNPEYNNFVQWMKNGETGSLASSIYVFWREKEKTKHCKWYEHEQDMKSVSEQFPNLIFMLEGAGEDATDLWKKFFKNGNMQTCYAKIVYDDYDPNKLKKIK